MAEALTRESTPDDPYPEAAEWPRENQAAALAEGWDIFCSDGSEDGPWQIQRLDDPEAWTMEDVETPNPNPFEGDADAWVHVRDKAAEESPLHVAALAFIQRHNPDEYDRIMAWRRGGPNDRSEAT